MELNNRSVDIKNITFDQTVDAKGLACPLPIVRTKKAMSELEQGKVLEVQATDRGSTADVKAWATSSGHFYLGTIEDKEVLFHYIRKASGEEALEKKHPHVVSNEQLQAKLNNDDEVILVDVRETAEYVFHHIPRSQSIPLGEMDKHLDKLRREKPIYVICRTGNRSDLAALALTEAGFKQVFNVLPGMNEWNI
ncbi:sulfurtransferase TusA family protein [Bacillus alkalicellulosilyticus]|uniref:sulfurtransferase TusA family protein n=1 Tax=Alkalihalobacterium alkalicellulosilyticum TaxID=1912214 RepID=UPI001482E764|nr:sulfurtransferase TusA family protein [Bacillus alkalicellulosilyticus]